MSKYHYPAGAVDVIIEKDDKLLLIRRKNEPFKGLLAIPGGFVNLGRLSGLEEIWRHLLFIKG